MTAVSLHAGGSNSSLKFALVNSHGVSALRLTRRARVHTRKHSDHSERSFKDHLLDVIKGSISSFISGTVIHFAYKGRR